MKLLDKFKNIFSKEGGVTGKVNRKLVGIFSLAIGNLVSVFAISIAWFGMASSGANSNVDMVTGDLNVKVNKVTAYKYVYPFYRNSTTYVDYDATGSIKRYVIENNGHDADLDIDYSDITISTDNATITLDSPVNGTISTDGTGVLSPTYIHYPRYDDFRFYIVGDSTFCGDDTHAWSTNQSIPFTEKNDPTNQQPVVVSNVMVPIGSKFILFDRKPVSGSNCKYLTYSSATENSPFKVLDFDEGLGYGTVLKCVKGGVYSFSYDGSSISITKQNASSLISNNSADATLVKFSYDGGSVDKEQYTLQQYMAEQVNLQNTMLILDVELDYQNVNKVRAGLQIERDTSKSARSVLNLTDKYNNTTDYITNSTVNASDFYSFYSMFVRNNDAFDASSPDASINELWLGMHEQSNLVDTINQVESPAFTKFSDTSYESVATCRIHKKDGTVASDTDLEIDASAEANIYHCYIGIEYDYEYSVFFTNQNRLGKTYVLDRDFSFHFTGVQVTEN